MALRSWVLILLAGGLSLSSRAAYFKKPVLSAGPRGFCLVDSNDVVIGAGVQCWDYHGNIQSWTLPDSLYPKEIGFGQAQMCFIDEEAHAYSYVGDKANGPEELHLSASHPQSIACSESGACAVDVNGDLHCDGSNVMITQAMPQGMKFRKVVMGKDHACAISTLNQLACWGGHAANADLEDIESRMEVWRQNLRLTAPSAYLKVKAPREVAIGSKGTTCVLDGDTLKCWPQIDPNVKLYWGKFPGGRTLETAHNLTVGRNFICVLSDPDLKCWKFNPVGSAEVPADFTKAEAVAAWDNTICAVHDNKVGCWGANSVRVDPMQFLFRLPNIANDLGVLSRSVYTPKARFFQRVAKMISERESGTSAEVLLRAQLFVFFAIQPLLENIQSKYVETALVTKYLTAKSYYAEKYGFVGLSDFVRDVEIGKVATYLVAAAVDAMADVAIAEEDKAAIADLKFLLGQALASNEVEPYVAGILSEMVTIRNTLDRLASNPRNRGMALLLEQLGAYLGGELVGFP